MRPGPAVLMLLASLAAAATAAQPPTVGDPAAPPGPQAPGPAAESRGGAGASGCDPQQLPEDPDRVTFEIPFTDERGAGTVTGYAHSIEGEAENRVVLSGGVKICYRDIEVKAERVELDQETRVVRAAGDVIFDQGPRRLTGETLVYDLEAETGSLTEAAAFVARDYFFEGAEIAKVDDDVYTVTQGVFTSCEADVPPWSFKVRRATVRVDGYARARGAALRTKDVPIFYLPWVVWPVRSERSSGLLVPKPGFSSRRGASLGLAYYQTLGRSYDTTFFLDLFSGGAEDPSAPSAKDGNYLGIGNEFRYHSSAGTQGKFEGYWINDPQFGAERWRVRYDHRSDDLPLGLRALVALEDVSDFEYFEDFDRSVEGNSRRQLYSNAFITGNWGPHSLNIVLDSRETFVDRDRSVELRQLPEVEYRLRSTRLGRSPLYLQGRGALHYLDARRSQTYDNTYGRAHFFPELTLPLRAFPWLSFQVTVGEDITFWEDSLLLSSEREAGESDFRGETLTRTNGTIRSELVGPSFSRIFSGGSRFSRYKHVIEPRFNYLYVEDFDDQNRVPVFDEIDPLSGRNLGTFSLINRLLAKPADEAQGGAREILSFELSQAYSFDDDRPLQSSRDRQQSRQSGPVRGLFRYNPSPRSTLRVDVAYDTLFSGVESTGVSGAYTFGSSGYNLGLRWSTRMDTELDDTRTNQVRLSAGLPFIPQKLTLNGMVNYDINQQEALLQRYLLNYQGSCYTLTFEFGDFRGGTRRDREYRLSITLKNVGTFLEINSSDHETL